MKKLMAISSSNMKARTFDWYWKRMLMVIVLFMPKMMKVMSLMTTPSQIM